MFQIPHMSGVEIALRRVGRHHENAELHEKAPSEKRAIALPATTMHDSKPS
jgi:hypothetical protein